MRIYKAFFILTSILFLFTGCEKLSDHEQFQRPEWLPGKLYTTLLVQENVSLFTECLQITGLDSILDVSGSWSIFAPTDEAMQRYLTENQYAKVSDIPKHELERIAEFHIVQNPWSLDQLQNLTAFGWRTRNDKNKYSYAYKRQTVLRNPVEKYWIKKTRNQEMIVMDSINSNRYKKVFVQSRKNVPIFYDEFLNVNGISTDDFNFYFDRPYEQGNVYFGGAKILEADIFAENGFIHIIDKVVNPMLNAKELLERELPNESYKFFLEMVYWYYPSFEANMPATYNQPEARMGGLADTIWDLNYLNLAFDPHKERTGKEGPEINETWVIHNGLYVPTDNAFRKFIDNILTAKSGFPHWSDCYSLPRDIVDKIIGRHFKTSSIYPSTSLYQNAFRVKGGFKQNEEAIIRKEFGSNCTFIGFDDYIPDRIFTSVTGPVFCRPHYSIFRLAMQYSNVHDVIANYDGELYFFPIPDYALNADSSLLLNWTNSNEYKYNFQVYNRKNKKIEYISPNALKNRILNQVGTSMPNGSANKEFIRTLGGNIITWDHSSNTIQGTLPNTIGYNGDSIVNIFPYPLEEPADNGKVWSVNFWFKFRSNNLQAVLSNYNTFYSLLLKAGLVDENSFDISFMNEHEEYTLFVPSDETLARYAADNLSVGELKTFLKNHFIPGEMIFTDNKQPSGSYLTAGGEPLNILTGPDFIKISDIKGKSYVTISEKEEVTNIMVSTQSKISAVVHEIDNVIVTH